MTGYMDSCFRDTVSNEDILGVYKTILLFLECRKFRETSRTFIGECKKANIELSSAQGKSFVLKPCNSRGHTCAKPEILHEEDYYPPPGYTESDDLHELAKEENPFKPDVLNQTLNSNHQKDTLESLREKFHNLQEEHKKLICITTELTTALQINLMGQTKNMHSMLDHCKKVYPELFIHSNSDMRNAFSCKNVENLETSNNQETSTDEEMKIPIERIDTNESFFTNIHSASSVPEEDDEEDQIEEVIKYNSLCSIRSNCVSETARSKSDSLSPKIIYRNKTNLSKNVSDSSNCSLKKHEDDKALQEDMKDILNNVIDVIVPSNDTESCDDGDGKSNGNSDRTVNLSKRKNEDSIEEIETYRCDKLGDGFDTDVSEVLCKPASPRKMEKKGFVELDFRRIKKDLLTVENDMRLRILQALRWRLTKSKPKEREQAMTAYVKNDVLDLHTKESIPQAFFKDPALHEGITRLLNTFASLKQGRDYFSTNESFIKNVLLRQVLDNKIKLSPTSRDMLIASFQKLSLRKVPRMIMVRSGLLEHLVEFLSGSHQNVSGYCLEYCSALMMNLCLEEEARERCAKHAVKVIGLLKTLLSGGHTCCLPYVNGSMYSLLAHPVINKEARKQQMNLLIVNQKKNTNDAHLQRQLDYILRSRFSGKIDTFTYDAEQEPQEEVDLLEAELDEGDHVTSLHSGDVLLSNYKCLFPKNMGNRMNCLCRPVTPASLKSHRLENKLSQTLTEELSVQTELLREKLACSSQDFSCNCDIIKPNEDANSLKPKMKGAISYNKWTRPDSKGKNFVGKPTSRIFLEKKTIKFSNRREMGDVGVGFVSPICYMDTCKLSEGNSLCSCCKCSGGSKYSCSCYETMKKEVDECVVEEEQEITLSEDFSKKEKSIVRQQNETLTGTEWPEEENTAIQLTPKVGASEESLACSCGKKGCDCAFQARPKLSRTP